jgi:predicted Rossmann-fold nucleotide-binding protein
MRHTRGRAVEVDSVADLDRRLAHGPTSMAGWHLVGLDLRRHGTALRARSVAGALFLGCRLDPEDDGDLRRRGATVFPEVPGVPVDPYRRSLYSPTELYDALGGDRGYEHSLDARAYAWSQQPRDRDVTLAQALHDHAIDTALAAWVAERRLVGVMGGHALQRDHPAYADAARLGRMLGRDAVVATGGGPGAMEAAALGAFLADVGPEDLDAALARLAAVPSFRPSVGAWAAVAMAVRREHPAGREGLGIPTWHYGHEPPHVFASAIAKYFANPTREAVLLEVCDAGIVFLPGAAGTVQEVFQDACENYYADESSLAPMVLLGRHFWTQELPAWPLLERLARGRAMAGRVHLVDTAEDARAALGL